MPAGVAAASTNAISRGDRRRGLPGRSLNSYWTKLSTVTLLRPQVSIVRWVAVFLVGYFAGTLQSNHYCASVLFTQQQPLASQQELNSHIPPGMRTSVTRATRKTAVGDPSQQQRLPRGGESLLQGQESVSGICQRLRGYPAEIQTALSEKQQTPSALDLWFQHYVAIHQASQLSTNDFHYKLSDFSAELLRLISPRLPKSTVALPQDWEVVRRILHKLDLRLDYLIQQHRNTSLWASKQTPPPPPVQILVMGGSVLVGRNCRKLLKDLNLQFLLPNRECTYSFRLQVFLDLMTHVLLQRYSSASDDSNRNSSPSIPIGTSARALAPQLFQVTKIAMGGTNTAVGSQIFKYDLLPDEARHADIVINGYATNDMHILTILEMKESGKTLRQGVFEMLQDFVRNMLRTNDASCKTKTQNQNDFGTPLLIHLDDYLGNEQREILQTMELSQSVSLLAQYYGFGAISYANLVRDWVYGDTREFWFSPEGWWNHQVDEEQQRRRRQPRGDQVKHTNTSGMEREIHPGMGAHIVNTWIIAYNFLHIASTYCSLEPYLDLDDHHHDGKRNNDGAPSPMEYDASSWASRLVPLNKSVKQAPGRPHEVPKNLPPKLTGELSLEHVSEEWQRQDLQSRPPSITTCPNDNAIHTTDRRCPYSWVGGLSLQQNNKTWINEFFSSHTVAGSPTWELVEENGKVGFLASPSTPEWQLEFPLLQTPVSTVTVFYLKSYGEKWKDSRVQVTIAISSSSSGRLLDRNHEEPIVASVELLGSHTKNTSEMYTHELPLKESLSISRHHGEKLRAAFRLTGGTTFKLLGMAICR